MWLLIESIPNLVFDLFNIKVTLLLSLAHLCTNRTINNKPCTWARSLTFCNREFNEEKTSFYSTKKKRNASITQTNRIVGHACSVLSSFIVGYANAGWFVAIQTQKIHPTRMPFVDAALRCVGCGFVETTVRIFWKCSNFVIRNRFWNATWHCIWHFDRPVGSTKCFDSVDEWQHVFAFTTSRDFSWTDLESVLGWLIN